MGFKHILLGNLLDLPTYGYDMIKKCFLDFTPANPKLNEGRLYTTLKRLESDGLVERRTRPQSDMPDQKIINITPLGVEEFYSWLESKSDEEGHVKFDFFNQYPFLTKVNFFNYLAEEQVEAKLNEQLQVCLLRIKRFNEAWEEMVQKNVDPYRIRILEYGLKVEKLKTEWLQELLDEVSSKRQEKQGSGYEG